MKNICRQQLLEIIMKLRKLRLVDYFFDVVRNKFQRINIYTRVVKKRMKGSREEYVMWTCFTFWTMKIIFWNLQANESLIMACLIIYQELLLLVTFLQVHSNSKSYLSWQNRYPNLKTTCHIKLKFFLWTKLLESLLLTKNLICCCNFNY